MPRTRTARRGSSQEWKSIVQRYEASGLTQVRFCRRHGVALSSLQRWRQRMGSGAVAADFVELTPATTPTPASTTWTLEVNLPNGAALRIQG